MTFDTTLIHLLKLAEVSGIQNKKKALQIINEVKAVVLKWEQYAKEIGVSAASIKMIQEMLSRVHKKIFY